MKTIYLIRYNENSPGVKVITDAFSIVAQKRGYNVIVTNKFPQERNADTSIITYGPKETYDAIQKEIPIKIALLVDNYSMGQLNKAKFFFRRGKIFYKDFWYSLATGILYRKRENKIASHVKNLMFVSQTDIDNFKERNPDNNYFLVPNGVNLPIATDTVKTKSETIRLGVLSNWTDVALHECKWFITDILPQLNKNLNKEVRLTVAGKGASTKIQKYFSDCKFVDYIGPVDSLSDFFCNIDLYIATVPRGCGILNKVLDAFAYRTPVLGIPESFSGFSTMVNSYIVCRNSIEFKEAISELLTTQRGYKYTINALNYITQNNNWIANYSSFIDTLIMYGII